MDTTYSLYHHNLARSFHCYVTTRTSWTFSIYLGAMYIVYHKWPYVRLFEFYTLTDVTPVYHHNLARSFQCYVTTRTSWTFSIYLGAMYIVYHKRHYARLFESKLDLYNLMDVTPVYHHNLARSFHCYVTTRTSWTFSMYLGAMLYSLS